MSVRFDFKVPVNRTWAGRAPGWVGLDQVNMKIPETVREGCAVPLTVESGGGSSQPVTISIRKGGGSCVDPPTAAIGQVAWETKTGTGSSPRSDVLTASFFASPGQRPPPELREGCIYNSIDDYGPSCPVPGYRNLDAGSITLQGPGLGPMRVIADEQGIYRAILPAGTIQPGSFSVLAGGGAEVSPFQSSLQIGPRIQITSSFPPGTILPNSQSVVVNWTSGDPDALVTMKLVHRLVVLDQYNVCRARASAGRITMVPVAVGFMLSLGIAPGPVELILEVTPDPSKVATFSAPELSLGGQHTWKYVYRFEGLVLQ